MNDKILQIAALKIKQHKTHLIWILCLSLLAGVVGTSTYRSLIVEAEAWSKEPVCGLEEHTHDISCYSLGERPLVCGLEESESHAHDETCYDEEGNLICGQEEHEGHVHGEECLGEAEPVLICERPEHVHTEACYPAEEVQPEETQQDEAVPEETRKGEETVSEDPEVTEQPETSPEAEEKKKPEETAAPEKTENEIIKDGKQEEDETLVFEQKSNGVVVKVSFENDEAFKESDMPVTMKVEPIREEDDKFEEYHDQIIDETKIPRARKLFLFDITFLNKDGIEVEPLTTASVSFTTEEIPVPEKEAVEKAEEQINVVHIPDEGKAEVMDVEVKTTEDLEDDEKPDVAFETDSFSIYGVVYTIDFGYELDGVEKSFTALGGSEIPVEEMLDELGISSEEHSAEEITGRIRSIECDVDGLIEVNAEDRTILLAKEEAIKALMEGKESAVLTITLEDDEIFYVTLTLTGTPEVQAGEMVTISSVDGTYLPEEAEGKAELLSEKDSDEAVQKAEEYKESTESAALSEGEEKPAVQYQVFDISLENVNADDYKEGFKVTVNLPEEIMGRDFRLYHIHDGETTDITDTLTTKGEAKDQNGVATVTGFEFVTDGFSQFVLSYTVDFHYCGIYSIPGNTQILLTQLIETMHITVPDNDEDSVNDPLLDINKVASVEFSDEHLVKVEQVSGIITINNADGVLTEADAGEYNFLLSSLEPFSTQEMLTITLKDGTVIKVGVTDAKQFIINFFDHDGVTPVDADMDGYEYLAVNIGIGNPEIVEVPRLTVNGSLVTASYEMDSPTGFSLVTMNDTEYLNGHWWYGVQRKDVTASFNLGAFKVTRKNDGTYIAVKQPACEVEIITSDGSIASGLGNDYSVYAGVDKPNQSGQLVRYHNSKQVSMDGLSSQSITFSDFNRINDNPNSQGFEIGDDVEIALVKNLQIEPNNEGRGNISGGTIIRDGDLLGNYTVGISKNGDKTTYTLTRNEPYKINIKTSADENVVFDEGYRGNWYLLSTLTKSNGRKYYYIRQVANGTNVINKVADQEIEKFYNSDQLSNISINSPSGNTSVYQSGDTVENMLVYTGSTQKSNYDEIVKAKEAYGDGDAVNKYTVSDNTTDGIGYVVLTPIPDFKVITVFKEADNSIVAAGDVPADYKLLIKMIRKDRIYYALHDVKSANPSEVSEPIKFYEYIPGQNGGAANVGTIPGYYSGSETLTTQVVTGAVTLPDALNKGTNEGVTRYNENIVNAENQNSDLTRDLFSTSSHTADNVMTTTFTRKKNNGIPHEITVNFYTEKLAYPGEDDKLNRTPGLDTADGAYFFVVRLYNKGKLVAYKVKEANIGSVNSTGSFTTTIDADETFIIVDDKGVDIPDSNKVKYDPTMYTSKVRLYKAKTAGSLPAMLADVENYGMDNLPGYDFMYNKDWTTDENLKTVNGDNIIGTATRLGLYNANRKKYQVKVVVDDGTELNDADQLRLYVEAAHQTTNKDIYADGDILAKAVKSEEGGKKVYTILIEDQTASQLFQAWTQIGKPGNTISGNEMFDLYLKQKSVKLDDRTPVSLTNGTAASLSGYEVTYDTDTLDENSIFLDKNVTTENGVTTITHYVYINNVNYEPAVGPHDVLGGAAEYGIVAHRYEQSGHTETNYAVHELYDSMNNSVNGAGGSDIPFYVGQIDSGTTVWVESETNNLYYFMTEEDKADKIDHNFAARINSNPDRYHIITLPKSEIDKVVTGLINEGASKSEMLKNKPAMMKPVAPQNGNLVLDTRMYPDGITIYVDCAGILGKMTETGWEINKLSNQSIVFNVPGTDVKISEMHANIYDPDNPNEFHTTSTSTSDFANSNGLSDAAKQWDRDIMSHITFNVYEARTLHLDTVSGAILAPNASSITQLNGAGTIVTGGTVTSRQEWHFYYQGRTWHYNGTETGFKASKFMKDPNKGNEQLIEPAQDQKYTFLLEELNYTTGEWVLKESKQNNGSSIVFSEFEFTAADEGEHYYRIREQNDNAATNIMYDTKTYIVRIDVGVNVAGTTVNTTEAETYWYINDNGSAAADLIESYQTEIFDLDIQGHLQPINNDNLNEGYRKKTVTRYRINRNYLTSATENEGGMTQSSTEEIIKFVNTCGTTFNARKILKGKKLTAGAFQFELLDSNGGVLATAANDEEGNVTFNYIANYSLNDLTNGMAAFTYTIREKLDNTGANSGNEFTVADGNNTSVYDGHEATVTVTVKDNGGGTLEVQKSSSDTAASGVDAVFTNTEYRKIDVDKKWFQDTADITDKIDKTKASLKVTLSAEGWDGKDLDGNAVNVAVTLPKDNNWSASWDKLPKENADGTVYVYKVTESEVMVSGVSLPDAEPVTVGDDGKAELLNNLPVITINGSKTWVDKKNSHNNPALTLKRTSTKEGSGAETLKAEAAAPTQYSADGTVNLQPVWDGLNYSYADLPKFDQEGYLYTYEVTEDPIDGYMSEEKLNEDPSGFGKDFVNTEVTTISAEKIWKLNGADITDPEGVESITLHLYRKNGDIVKLISNDSERNVFDTTTADGYVPFTIQRQKKSGTDNEYIWPTLAISDLPKYWVDETDSAKTVKEYSYYFVEDLTSLTDWSVTYDNGSGEPSTQGNSRDTTGGIITITNSKYTTSLPHTGGIGTGVIYGTGAGLMLLAVLGFILRKKAGKDID